MDERQLVAAWRQQVGLHVEQAVTQVGKHREEAQQLERVGTAVWCVS